MAVNVAMGSCKSAEISNNSLLSETLGISIGPHTKASVQSFQAWGGVGVDGVCSFRCQRERKLNSFLWPNFIANQSEPASSWPMHACRKTIGPGIGWANRRP